MWESEGLTFSPDDFSGQVRLFPLPNLVLFPSVMQPLHIFEPRYREMLEDALQGDRLIAMCLLQGQGGGPEPLPVHPVACLGKIASHKRQLDGRYDLLLLGVRRVLIREELAPLRSFRQAKVDLLADDYAGLSGQRQDNLQAELTASFRRVLGEMPHASEQLEELFGRKIPLGMLTDIAAYTLNLDLRLKQKLLSECCVQRRTQLLLQAVENLLREGQRAPFPPPFSDN